MLYFPQTRALLAFTAALQEAIQSDAAFQLPILEHSTIQKQNIKDPVTTLVNQGYYREERGEVTFYGKPNEITIEVVPNTTPRHVGYLFSKLEHLDQLADLLGGSNRWKLADSSLVANEDSIKWFMFRYDLTGDHFQTIWRKEPLFVWKR